MTEPRVTRIRIEYDDGSHDDVEQRPQDGIPFYDFHRSKTPRHEGADGLHTAGDIASILFLTALHGIRREYSITDPELQKLCKGFFE